MSQEAHPELTSRVNTVDILGNTQVVTDFPCESSSVETIIRTLSRACILTFVPHFHSPVPAEYLDTAKPPRFNSSCDIRRCSLCEKTESRPPTVTKTRL